MVFASWCTDHCLSACDWVVHCAFNSHSCLAEQSSTCIGFALSCLAATFNNIQLCMHSKHDSCTLPLVIAFFKKAITYYYDSPSKRRKPIIIYHYCIIHNNSCLLESSASVFYRQMQPNSLLNPACTFVVSVRSPTNFQIFSPMESMLKKVLKNVFNKVCTLIGKGLLKKC